MVRTCTAAALATAVTLLSACSSSSGGEAPGVEVGSGGGVVTDPSGATLTIPPGALDAPARVVLRVHARADELPASFGVYAGWAGSVELEPAGLRFALPVEVALPLHGPLAPSGGTLPVFHLEPGGWRRHLPDATVDGAGARFTTDHFSTFALAADHARATAWVAPLVEAFVADPAGIEGHVDDHLAWLQDVAGLRLGARWPASVPGQGYECQELVGLVLVVDAHWLEGEAVVPRVLGRETPGPVVWDAFEERATPAGDLLLRATLSMYYECASPDLALTATPARVRPDEQAALAATLSCGGLPMAGRGLDFDVSSGPGAPSPPGDTTGDDGVARSAFRAAEAGVATVEAVDLACRAFAPRTVAASATVTVADEPARWSATISSRAVVEEGADAELVWDARVNGSLPFRSGDPACAAEVAARFALSGEYDVCGGGVLATSSTLEGYSYEDESCDDVQLSVGPAEVYLFGVALPDGAAAVTFVLTTEQVCSYVVRCCVFDYCTDASGADACTNQDGTCHGASCCWDRGPDDPRNEPHCGVSDAIHGMRDAVWTPSPYLEVTLAEGATRSATMPAELGFRPGSAWTLRIDRAP